jgi:hypothetical protein
MARHVNGTFTLLQKTYTKVRPYCSSTRGYVLDIAEATFYRVESETIPSVKSYDFAIAMQCLP